MGGARRAVLEFRLERGILEPMVPVPEDFVYSCRQSANAYLTFPNKPLQGTYWIKRPQRERTFAAAEYYSQYARDISTELSYGGNDNQQVCAAVLNEYVGERAMIVPPKD